MKPGRMSLKMRMVLGFSITPCIMIALIVIGIFRVNQISRSLTTINDVNSVKQRYAINFRGSVHDRAISLRDVVLYSAPQDIETSLKEIESLETFYTESAIPLDKIFAESSVTDEEVKLLSAIKDIEAHTLPLAKRVIDAKKGGNEAQAWNLLMNEAKPAFSEWLARINKFIDYQENLNRQESKIATEIASAFQMFMVLLTLSSVVFASIVGYLITRSMVSALMKVAGDLDKTSQSVTNVSSIISESSKSLASGAGDQAETIVSISSSLVEMNEMIHRSAQGSKSTSQLAIETRTKAVEGEEVVNQMVGAIEEIQHSNDKIKTQVDESSAEILSMSSVISEIADKTKVVNDIVFQTKLLSFNASVEAARAGEHGKGFAVVAQEIGNLAQMSGNAAKEIFDLLASSKEKVETIANNINDRVNSLVEDSRSHVSSGSMVAKKCRAVFDEIVTKVNEVSQMAEQISVAANEQSQGFNDITNNISNMDKVTQYNAKLATETASTLESLNVQTREMRQAFTNLSDLVGTVPVRESDEKVAA